MKRSEPQRLATRRNEASEIRFLHAPTKSKRSLHLVICALFYGGLRRATLFATPFGTQNRRAYAVLTALWTWLSRSCGQACCFLTLREDPRDSRTIDSLLASGRFSNWQRRVYELVANLSLCVRDDPGPSAPQAPRTVSVRQFDLRYGKQQRMIANHSSLVPNI